jgi:hypothetical protein
MSRAFRALLVLISVVYAAAKNKVRINEIRKIAGGDTRKDVSVQGEVSIDKNTKEDVTQRIPNVFAQMYDQLPSLQFRIDPSTKLKLRKFFSPYNTKVEIGADFDSQESIWEIRGSVEEKVLNGKVAVKGREFQYLKTWMVGVSENELLRTRLRLKVAVDMLNGKTYCRFGFRTEESSLEGFPLETKILLDKIGNNNNSTEGHVFCEVSWCMYCFTFVFIRLLVSAEGKGRDSRASDRISVRTETRQKD